MTCLLRKVKFSTDARSRRVRQPSDPEWLLTDGKRYRDLEMLDDLETHIVVMLDKRHSQIMLLAARHFLLNALV